MVIKRLKKFLEYHNDKEVKVIDDNSNFFGAQKLEYIEKKLYLDYKQVPVEFVKSIYVYPDGSDLSSIFIDHNYDFGGKK